MSEWRVHGCGSASSSRSLQSSYEWIEDDFRLQIDFGYGALYRRCLAEGNIFDALDGMQHLFISHGHPDHMADISRLVIALKHTPNYTPKRQIGLFGTQKTLNDVKIYLDSVGLEDTFDEVFHPHSLETGETFERNGHGLIAIPANHRDGAIGLRIQSPAGRTISYSGDTGPFEGQEDYLQDLDLLVIEASFMNSDLPFHMTAGQAAELAGTVRPRALMPVHFYPEMEQQSNFSLTSLIAKWYDGDIFIARDGNHLIWNDPLSLWDLSGFL